MSAQSDWLKAFDELEAAKARLSAATHTYAEIPNESAKKWVDEAEEELRGLYPAFAVASEFLAIELRGDPSVITQLTRDEAIQMMGDIMSEISERCYCAGWMDGTEEVVPQLVAEALSTGQDQGWCMNELRLHEAKHLKALNDYLGHWVDFNMGDGPTYIPYTPEKQS